MHMTMVDTHMVCTAMHTVMAITTIEAAAVLAWGEYQRSNRGVVVAVVTGCSCAGVHVWYSVFSWAGLSCVS